MNQRGKKVLKAVVTRVDVITVLLLSLALTAFFLSRNSQFLSVNNIFNMVQQNAALIIVSVGMTFIVISGNMDLSSGSLIVLTACVTGVVFRGTGSIWLGLAACLGAAALIGTMNASLVAYGKINAVIITLSCMIREARR